MTSVFAVFKREFFAYFATPLAVVFIVIFLFAMGAFTFYVGRFFDNGVADLSVFFGYHPWLYLFLLPALSMRLWAEERKSGTVELLTTLPIPLWACVVGKYLAALAVAAIALFLTFPIWLTVNLLGDPDNGVIAAGYLGSLLMAGGYLAIGSCVSAATENQVVAFVATVTACFLFALAGSPLVLDVFRAVLPDVAVEAIASFGFLTHFTAIAAGALDVRDVAFFVSLIALFLFVNTAIIDLRKGGR
jgi:ABC-2 type transport system permease protein